MGGFWAGMIKLTPGTKVVRYLPWFVLEMTPHIVQVFQPEAQPKVLQRLLTSAPALTRFPTAVYSRNRYCFQIAEKVMQSTFHFLLENVLLEDH